MQTIGDQDNPSNLILSNDDALSTPNGHANKTSTILAIVFIILFLTAAGLAVYFGIHHKKCAGPKSLDFTKTYAIIVGPHSWGNTKAKAYIGNPTASFKDLTVTPAANAEATIISTNTPSKGTAFKVLPDTDNTYALYTASGSVLVESTISWTDGDSKPSFKVAALGDPKIVDPTTIIKLDLNASPEGLFLQTSKGDYLAFQALTSPNKPSGLTQDFLSVVTTKTAGALVALE